MKHIISKMFGTDNTDDMDKLKARLISFMSQVDELDKLMATRNATMSANIRALESKLENSIAAMEIMINRHNDLSSQFQEFKKNGKTKYIAPQK